MSKRSKAKRAAELEREDRRGAAAMTGATRPMTKRRVRRAPRARQEDRAATAPDRSPGGTT